MINHKVKCSNFEISNDKPFTLIAGPCQLENEKHALKKHFWDGFSKLGVISDFQSNI